jgi:hypothetical protein
MSSKAMGFLHTAGWRTACALQKFQVAPTRSPGVSIERRGLSCALIPERNKQRVLSAWFVGKRHHLQRVALQPFGVPSVITCSCQDGVRESKSCLLNLCSVVRVVMAGYVLPSGVKGREDHVKRVSIEVGALDQSMRFH